MEDVMEKVTKEMYLARKKEREHRHYEIEGGNSPVISDDVHSWSWERIEEEKKKDQLKQLIEIGCNEESAKDMVENGLSALYNYIASDDPYVSVEMFVRIIP